MRSFIKKSLCALLAIAAILCSVPFTVSAGGDGPEPYEGFLLYAESADNKADGVLVGGRVVKGPITKGATGYLRSVDPSTKEVTYKYVVVKKLTKAITDYDQVEAGEYVGVTLDGITVADVHPGDALVSPDSPFVTTTGSFEGYLELNSDPSIYASEWEERQMVWATGASVTAYIDDIPGGYLSAGRSTPGVIVRTYDPVTWYVGQKISVVDGGVTVGYYTITNIGTPIYAANVNGIGHPFEGRLLDEVAAPEVQGDAGFTAAVGWFDETEMLYLDPVTGEFKEGNLYRPFLRLTPKDGFFFSRDCLITVNGSWQRVADSYFDDRGFFDVNLLSETASVSEETLESLGRVRYRFGFNNEASFYDWTVGDTDGDGHTWMHSEATKNAVVPHEGQGAIISVSYDPTTGESYTPDNLIVSPALMLPGGKDYLSFRAATAGTYEEEIVSVYVSPVDEPWVLEEVMAPTHVYGRFFAETGEHFYTCFLVDLSKYAGKTVKVMFRHNGTFDISYLVIDDVRIISNDCLPCDGAGGCPGKNFTDMPAKDNWAHDPIDWAVVYGITKGTSETKFSLDAGCTRAQAVTFLWRAVGCPEPAGTSSPFTDVKEDDYFFDAVLWAVETGITQGTSATAFSPNFTCTRAQIATFLWRLKGSPDPVSPATKFTDVTTGDYFYRAVLWAADNGITKGTTDTTFSPSGTCTRAQIVAFLYRCLFLNAFGEE